jgi:hypothetical protein
LARSDSGGHRFLVDGSFRHGPGAEGFRGTFGRLHVSSRTKNNTKKGVDGMKDDPMPSRPTTRGPRAPEMRTGMGAERPEDEVIFDVVGDNL